MTNSQAKSELMQIYMSLSEEKKMALDVLMAQADGEYISRQAVIDCFKKWQPYMATRLHEFEKELSELLTVDIPPDHDGCKDCKHELKSAGEYPCSYCKQNYNDMWQKKPYEPTCDTCEYNTATFNPCNACKNKSEYKPQERSDKK